MAEEILMQRRALSLIVLLLSATFSVVGCRHKKRLTGNDFDLRISPSATTAVKGSTVTLRALAGGGEINPTWEVSGVGTLSTNIGQTVEFMASQLGDSTVTATYDGVAATAQIAVVAFVPEDASTFFTVYTDAGLPSGTGILSDIDVFCGPAACTQTLSEQQSGYTTEGIKYQQGTAPTSGFSGWDVTLDDDLTGRHKDLSSFSSGRLRFSIRLHRLLAMGEEVRAEIDDTIGGPGSGGGVNLIASGYMSGQGTDWQDVSVPIAVLAPAQNLALIKVPFAIVLINAASPVTFDIDAVRWEK
jgi:hypothetical protein